MGSKIKMNGREAVQLFRIAALEYGNCRAAAYLNKAFAADAKSRAAEKLRWHIGLTCGPIMVLSSDWRK